jgi:hypothetical protein
VQWKDKTVLIGNPVAGLWYYTPTAHTDTSGETFNAGCNAASAAMQGTALAVFKGRVFVAQGRTINYSAPDKVFDFTGVASGTAAERGLSALSCAPRGVDYLLPFHTNDLSMVSKSFL